MTVALETDSGLDTPEIQAKFWAQGNALRIEMPMGDVTGVTIQQGKTLFTFLKDAKSKTGYSQQGRKMAYSDGLSSMGLLKQIDTVLKKGRKSSTREINGEAFSTYVYDASFPRDVAVVMFDDSARLPRLWVTFPENSEDGRSPFTVHFSQLEANKEIADSLFVVPDGIVFTSVNAIPLASGFPVPEVPSLPDIQKSNSTDQLYCVYSVTKYEVNGVRRKVSEERDLSFFLDANGYSIDSFPLVSPEIDLRLIYDRPKQTLTEVWRGKNEYRVNPVVSMVHFKAHEVQHRARLCSALEASGLPKTLACTRLELEAVLGIRMSPLQGSMEELGLLESSRGTERLFRSDGQLVSSYKPSEVSLSKELSHSLQNLFAHRMVMHPSIREKLVSTNRLPESYVVSVKQFERGGSFRNYQIEYVLKETDRIRNEDWNQIPDGFIKSDAQYTHEVAELSRLLSGIEKPSSDALLTSSRKRMETLVEKRRDSAALMTAFRYWEISGDRDGYQELLTLLEGRHVPLVNKFLNGEFEKSDFEQLIRVVSLEDDSVLPVAEYLLVDSAMGNGWEIDAKDRLVQCLKREPLLAGAYLDLGRVLVMEFEMPSAWRCWEMGAELRPDHPGLNAILETESELMKDFPDHF